MKTILELLLVGILISAVYAGISTGASFPALTNATASVTTTFTPTPLSVTATPANQPPYTSPMAWPRIALLPAFDGFTTDTYMTAIVPPTDGTDRVFISEIGGLIHVLVRKPGQWNAGLFLDITDRVNTQGEFGLYSVAFPPTYAESGHFYVKYLNNEGDVVISRFEVSPTNPNQADPDSEEIVLVIEQPPYPNHKGGTIDFGVDGMLYIGVGDGGYPGGGYGGVGDPDNVAQDPASLLGKMLRVDVETNDPLTYTIPSDNPFTDTVGYRPEIWLTGLRNPWIFSFDTDTGNLFIGDVGHTQWEEIHIIEGDSGGGENLGWSCFEGEYIYKNCPEGTYRRPEWTYSHVAINCGVVGGYVYHGFGPARMQGVYFYGDLCTGGIHAMRQLNGVWQSNLVGKGDPFIIFGRDAAGEIYVGGNTAMRLFEIGVEPIVTPTASGSVTPTATPTIPVPFPPLYLPLVYRGS